MIVDTMKSSTTGIKKPILFSVLFAIVLALVGLRDSRKSDSDIPVATAKIASIEVKIHASGKLEAADAKVISSNLPGDSGKIIWLIPDGARVKKGDILVRFDSIRFEEALKQLEAQAAAQEAVVEALDQALQWEQSQSERLVNTAEYELKVAKMELEQLEQGEGPLELARKMETLNKARQKLASLRGYLEDLRRLLKQGYVDEMEVKKTEMDLQAASMEVEVAVRKYESFKRYILPARIEKKKAEVARKLHALEEIKKTGGFKIGQARAKLKEGKKRLAHLQEKLQAAKRRLEDTVIKAPEEGMVVLAERFYGGVLRKPRVGDRAWQGQPLLYLPETGKMMVKARVRELDLHSLFIGQKAIITVDAFPELTYSGTVRAIGAMAETSREGPFKGNFFSVEIDMKGYDKRLRPGMTARVTILGQKKDKAIVIPVAGLFGSKSDYFCYVRQGRSWMPQKVEPGILDASMVEVVSGIEPGQEIALVDPFNPGM